MSCPQPKGNGFANQQVFLDGRKYNLLLDAGDRVAFRNTCREYLVCMLNNDPYTWCKKGWNGFCGDSIDRLRSELKQKGLVDDIDLAMNLAKRELMSAWETAFGVMKHKQADRFPLGSLCKSVFRHLMKKPAIKKRPTTI